MMTKNKPDYKQREIKFRVVWNNEVSTNSFTIGDFIEGAELQFKDGGCLPMADIDWGTDTVTYIQRTGLKDKNGVDVYEGDVVSYYDQGPYPIKFGQCSINGGEYTCFGYYIDKKPKEILTPFDTDYLIVVGNIFENPELLNQ